MVNEAGDPDELKLARAAGDDRGARAALLDRYAGVLEDALARLAIGDAERDAVLERTLASLARYEGERSLAAWLRAAVARAAAEIGAASNGEATSGEFWRTEDEDDEVRPEVAAAVGAALSASADALTARQRNVLRFHLNDGLGLDEIGAIYRTTRAEVARELSAARAALLDVASSHVADRCEPEVAEAAQALIEARLDAVAQQRFSTVREEQNTDPERPSALGDDEDDDEAS